MKTSKSIYKFYRINKYSLDALKNNYIFCNHYSAFNDPFECWCKVNTGIPHHETETERFLNVIGVWGFTPDRAEEAREYYYDYFEHFENEQIDVEAQINRARISCFSTDPANLLMWAHYADGLRGFYIEFDPKALVSEENYADIINVSYPALPPTLETICYPLANDIYWHGEDEDSSSAVDYMHDFYSKMLATKPRQWKYEKEVRLISSSNENSKKGKCFYYQQQAVKSIVFGDKISDNHKRMLQKLIKVKDLTIPVGIASRSKGSYKLNISYI